MPLLPLGLAAFASLVALGAFGQYLATIPRHRVPVRPVGTFVALAVALALALAAIALAWSGGDSPLLALGAGLFAHLLAPLFFWLYSQRRTPLGKLQVKVGDRLLPFRAATSEGAPFDSASLAGERILLKFFRGQWCPYCSAELRLFDELAPRLSEHGVRVVALSKDTVADAAYHKRRDGLSLTLLSDPDLAVIRQYGVEHHKAVEFSKGRLTIGGLPLALVPEVKTMAIPTSLLVDEHGVVRWIDQSEDYRLRSSEERVLGAVREAFASAPAAARAA